MRSATRDDVARAAGVSTAVVSYVINDGPRAVSPRTRERVLRAIEELGYLPHGVAQALAAGSSRSPGLGGHSMPVEIGGQLVRPGDLVVADGDGAIVVPVDVIDDVLKYAIQESEGDRVARGVLFDRLGIPRNDSTVSQFDVAPHPYVPTAEKLDQMLRRNR